VITEVAEVLAVHRWKSMGLNTVECECGEILAGGMELTGFPADQAFREHLAQAVLNAAAAKLEMLARWKFKAGSKIWAWSDYGKLDNWDNARIGERGLAMCGQAGQMERDAKRLRGVVEKSRRWR